MIRELTAADIPTLKALLDEVYSDSPFPIGGGWNECLLRDALKDGRGFALISTEQTGEVIRAFLIYRSLEDLFDITVLATARAFQRTGSMTQLFEHLRQQPGVQRIWLEVHEANTAAVAFYERLGFSFQGRRPNYYRDGGTALLYSLEKRLPK